MEQGPSWGASQFAAGQGIPRVLHVVREDIGIRSKETWPTNCVLFLHKGEQVNNTTRICLLSKLRIAVAFPQFVCTWQADKRLKHGQSLPVRRVRCGMANKLTRREFVTCNPVWIFARYTGFGNTTLKLLHKCSQTYIHSLHVCHLMF